MKPQDLTPEFPEWVPPAVARLAQAMLQRGEGHTASAVALRLVRDARMQSVWEGLEKRWEEIHRELVERAAPAERREQIERWGQSFNTLFGEEEGLDLILATFFWNAHDFAVSGVEAVTASEVDDLRELFAAEAAALRNSASRLRRAGGWRDGFGRASALALPQWPDLNSAEQLARSVEEAAKFYDTAALKFSDAIKSSPLRVERDHGSARERGYVRMLNHVTPPGLASPSLLATVANVALAPAVDVTPKQAGNWCLRSMTNKDA